MPFEKTIAMVSSALMGSGLLSYGLYQKHKVRESQGWTQTTGTVTKADLVHETGTDSSGYSIAVSYEYLVDGVRLAGNRIGFRQRSYLRKQRAETELARYPVGSDVEVFYDPANPGDAVLARESVDGVLLIVSGIVLLSIAIAGTFFGRRARTAGASVTRVRESALRGDCGRAPSGDRAAGWRSLTEISACLFPCAVVTGAGEVPARDRRRLKPAPSFRPATRLPLEDLRDRRFPPAVLEYE